jgi:hypothetical protein
MTPYQVLLLILLVAWPLAIAGVLFLMQRLEHYVARLDAATPEEAGLVPVEGDSPEREVKIVFEDHVVGDPEPSPE